MEELEEEKKPKTKIKDRSSLVLNGTTENIVFLEKSYTHDGEDKMVKYGLETFLKGKSPNFHHQDFKSDSALVLLE